jgi:hypothetical protein
MPSIRTIAQRVTSILVSVLLAGCGTANTTNETPSDDAGEVYPEVVDDRLPGRARRTLLKS